MVLSVVPAFRGWGEELAGRCSSEMEGSRFGMYRNDLPMFVSALCMPANLCNRRLPGTNLTRGLSIGRG
jgi:hypothetical protein